LFESGPGSGFTQVHDFNGGIQPSGLFWVVDLPEDAIQISNNGQRATVHAENVPVIDSFMFSLAPAFQVPALVNYSMTWQAIGRREKRGRGTAVDPTDPAAFLGNFAPAVATGSFSGRELGFSFKVDPGASSAKGGFAEMGEERNGKFLH